MIKKILIKINLLIYMLAFSAGLICFACGFGFDARVPKDVTVNGVAVGGMTRAAAVKALRGEVENGLKGKTLEVRGGKTVYKFTYPEIRYKDDLPSVIKTARRGGEYTAQISYYLCGLNEIAPHICLNESVFAVEPHATFSAYGEPFTYYEGRDGRVADEEKLIADIKRSLENGFEPVNLRFYEVLRRKTMQEVKQNTRLLTSFTTYFDGENINRSSNIRLAAAKLNGTVLESGKTLSFNDIVGARVKERGFLPAKIIENGEFVEGVGGGVCQVSTTLYNAALLSGLKIAEYHPHSLAVGYVPPSRDAMVSGSSCDLKITNEAETPIYIRANSQNGSVTFKIYGADGGAEYSLSSSVTGSIPAEEELTDDPLKARAGRDGTLSEGFLTVTRGGYSKTVRIRKDKYLPVKKVTYANENCEIVYP